MLVTSVEPRIAWPYSLNVAAVMVTPAGIELRSNCITVRCSLFAALRVESAASRKFVSIINCLMGASAVGVKFTDTAEAASARTAPMKTNASINVRTMNVPFGVVSFTVNPLMLCFRKGCRRIF